MFKKEKVESRREKKNVDFTIFIHVIFLFLFLLDFSKKYGTEKRTVCLFSFIRYIEYKHYMNAEYRDAFGCKNKVFSIFIYYRSFSTADM